MTSQLNRIGRSCSWLARTSPLTEAGLKVLGGGLAGSAVLDAKGEKMRNREFAPGIPDRAAPQGHGASCRRPPARLASTP
ncbi:hypothetical protein [Saccharopolyspora phatthalungensis]|uniref:Uncharacterized protein n=1 Tax=Saccharopolyspora phatthalungensis TaxID=664693 RepID=A0A840Q4C1_9PSEU|nr:hypothetical protein [Saccharopolyspora phatthalungensis]MBB5154827.1 hypothetical protein [Saccharopolyspora phatthalungensis]